MKLQGQDFGYLSCASTHIGFLVNARARGRLAA